MKRVVLLAIILLSLLSIAQAKIEVSTAQESFRAGENITLKVTLLDENNNPVQDKATILIEDAEKITQIEKEISTNEFIDINLGTGITHGYWSITATYNEEQAKTLFLIDMNELAKFELIGDELIITNMGNSRYARTIQIIIGDTIGVRNPELDIGEQAKYRLVAPEGDYSIKVTDGVTSITKNSVQLSGTGQVIGALDQKAAQRSGITGSIAPDEENDLAMLSFMKQNSLIYVFVVVVFGVAILLTVQRKLIKRKA